MAGCGGGESGDCVRMCIKNVEITLPNQKMVEKSTIYLYKEHFSSAFTLSKYEQELIKKINEIHKEGRLAQISSFFYSSCQKN